MKTIIKIVGIIVIIILIQSCKKEVDNVIKDIDGNVYTSVSIGTQVWMVENLKTTKYNDSTAIPLVTDSVAWDSISTSAYCWYNNDAAVYKSIYGALYNWYAVNADKLCPNGWHVPSSDEWTTLTTSLGGDSIAAGKLKETGTTHWATPNTGATNSTGFTALPGGMRGGYGSFYYFGYLGSWWSSSKYSAATAIPRYIEYSDTYVDRDIQMRSAGMSVRCLKDN